MKNIISITLKKSNFRLNDFSIIIVLNTLKKFNFDINLLNLEGSQSHTVQAIMGSLQFYLIKKKDKEE